MTQDVEARAVHVYSARVNRNSLGRSGGGTRMLETEPEEAAPYAPAPVLRMTGDGTRRRRYELRHNPPVACVKTAIVGHSESQERFTEAEGGMAMRGPGEGGDDE